MRTVDPLGRYEECDAIVEAVRDGNHVIVVGHPALGSEPVRRRVRRVLGEQAVPTSAEATLGAATSQDSQLGLHRRGSTVLRVDTEQGPRFILFLLDALDPARNVEIPPALQGEQIVYIRLERLGRRITDRLIDDRLARRGINPGWLGHTDRAMIHALSAGYPPLAAALVDDRLSPHQPQRTAPAVAQLLGGLPPRVRHAATAIAALPGASRARLARHVDASSLQLLFALGFASDNGDGVRLGQLFAQRIAASGFVTVQATTNALTEIVDTWDRAETSTSEIVLAAGALEDGTATTTPRVHATILTIAAARLVATDPVLAMQWAARALEVDNGIAPRLNTAIAQRKSDLITPFLSDASSSSPTWIARVMRELVRAALLQPDIDPIPDPVGTRSHDLGSIRAACDGLVAIANARAAIARGDFASAIDACQSIKEHDDSLISMHALGMVAVSAAALGRAPLLLSATTDIRKLKAGFAEWTPPAIVLGIRTVVQTRAAVASTGLPSMQALDDRIDHLVRIALETGEIGVVGYATLADFASSPTVDQIHVARRLLDTVVPSTYSDRAQTLLDALHEALTSPISARVIRERPFTAQLSVGVAALASVEFNEPHQLLERIESQLDSGIQPTATLQIVRAHLQTTLGIEPSDHADLAHFHADELPPVLRAMLWHVRGSSVGDGELVSDAAALVVAAKHRRLASTLIARADRLGADRQSLLRLRSRLASSVSASAKHLRANRQWIDRDAAALAAAGLTDVQIADLVGVPLGTVRRRSRSIMAGLGVPSRDQMRDTNPGLSS